MDKNSLRQFFRIPEEYVIDRLETQDGSHLVYCHSRQQGIWHAGKYSKTVSERRVRRVRHLMIEDAPVELIITQRRFRFSGPATCRWEKLPGVARRGKTSEEFRKNTLRELQTQNYSQAGKKRAKAPVMP